MGITHFAPVGTRSGAVTSALVYLKHNQNKFSEFKGQIIEKVVVFTSPEVRNGELDCKKCKNNEYGSSNGPEWESKNVLDMIKKFAEKELKSVIPDKGSIHICIVNPNDYDDCFDKIAKTLLKFTQGVGEHIWMNFTGGTNVMNIALLEVALLSGRVGRLYYTFLSDIERYGNYLQPPSEDKSIFRFVEIPFMKRNFDENYYKVLRVYKKSNGWLSENQVLSCLKGKDPGSFSKMSIETFKRDYLNVMDGRELICRDKTTNKITEYGKITLEKIDSSLFKALVAPKTETGKEQINGLTADLDLEKLWSKS